MIIIHYFTWRNEKQVWIHYKIHYKSVSCYFPGNKTLLMIFNKVNLLYPRYQYKECWSEILEFTENLVWANSTLGPTELSLRLCWLGQRRQDQTWSSSVCRQSHGNSGPRKKMFHSGKHHLAKKKKNQLYKYTKWCIKNEISVIIAFNVIWQTRDNYLHLNPLQTQDIVFAFTDWG